MIATLDRKLLHRLPLPGHEHADGKEDRGRVMIVGGSPEVPGGAALAGLAALRSGCGKLQIATDAGLTRHMGLAIPEARVLSDEPERVKPLLDKCDAVAFGPGWVDEAQAAAKVKALCAGPGPPAVLDAASLAGARFATGRRRALILTPHRGEMAALMEVEIGVVNAEPAAAARAAASRFGAHVALKGATTFIATPDGRLLRHDKGSLGLATSGSGDVLTGLVAGLLARGADPLAALAWAVFVHARAGERLTARIGPLGFLAREIIDEIPGVLAGG